MSKTRDVLTEEKALNILKRNRIKLEYPKIFLPEVGPGLKIWKAIDALVGYYRYILMPRNS